MRSASPEFLPWAKERLMLSVGRLTCRSFRHHKHQTGALIHTIAQHCFHIKLIWTICCDRLLWARKWFEKKTDHTGLFLAYRNVCGVISHWSACTLDGHEMKDLIYLAVKMQSNKPYCNYKWTPGKKLITTLLCFYQMNSHSGGTHSLHRIHWWVSDAMLNFFKSLWMKKQTHLNLEWSVHF